MTDDVQRLVADIERAVDPDRALHHVVGQARRRRRHRHIARGLSLIALVALAAGGVAIAMQRDQATHPADTVPDGPAIPRIETMPSPFGPEGDLDLIIAIGPGRQMAFGATSPFGPTQARQRTNGSWGQAAELGYGAGNVLDAAYNGATIVALTDSPAGARTWRSPDGENWSSTGLPGAASAFSLFGSAETGFVVGGATDDQIAVWSSDDGTSWRLDELGRTPYDIRGVAARGGDVVAVGLQGVRGAAWLRPAGSTAWEGGSSDAFGHGAIVQDIVATADGFIAAGAVASDNRFAVWRSADGITWSEVPTIGLPTEPTEGGIQNLAQTPFGLLGVVSPTQVFISADGETWAQLHGIGSVPQRSSYTELTNGEATAVVVDSHPEVLT